MVSRHQRAISVVRAMEASPGEMAASVAAAEVRGGGKSQSWAAAASG
jgi:hypothetical protein